MPIALAERREAGLWRQSVFVAENVGDGRTLGDLSKSVTDAGARRRILDAQATAVADMHRMGL